MSLAGKTLKEFYPTLMHVTCIAHLLNNCAMRVRAFFKNTDEVGSGYSKGSNNQKQKIAK